MRQHLAMTMTIMMMTTMTTAMTTITMGGAR